MKETIKKKIKDGITTYLDESHPTLSEYQKNKIANDVRDMATDYIYKNSEGLQLLVSNAVTDLEQFRHQFQEYIDFLQLTTKKILEILKKQGVVYYEYDQKKKKNVMKGRSAVLTETVEYFNLLNDMVIDYYKNVYKVETTSDKLVQSALF
jgi:hypothetical protein